MCWFKGVFTRLTYRGRTGTPAEERENTLVNVTIDVDAFLAFLITDMKLIAINPFKAAVPHEE